MSEQTMRQEVVRALKRLHAVSIETPMRPGFPDVSYADGLLELKWLRSWPDRADAPVAIPHYSPQQRLFHMKRHMADGRMFLVLQVAREWFIFDGRTAAERVGYASRSELARLAAFRFASPSELLPWLIQQQR